MNLFFMILFLVFSFFCGVFLEHEAQNITQNVRLEETLGIQHFFSRPLISGGIFLIMMTGFYLIWHFSFSLLLAFLIGSCLFFSALTDLYSGYVFDVIPFLMVLSAFAIRILGGKTAFIDGILGAGIGVGIMGAIRLFSKGGVGQGDIKLMGGVGMGLGTKLTLCSLYIGFFCGGLIASFLLLARKVHKKQPIPFVPFLALGGIIALLAAPMLEHIFGLHLPWPWGN
ncbi:MULTISPECIES: prepilin peptidase [Aminobacterium]|jgi:leader peptidase (prepilin peptidase)/N-methyltransferase|uniref:prepilin peptidase n=2 Tax=Aminobacteriaceae TaxID=3029087 RepID=UPI00257A21EF|nr:MULTISPECIES: A24 family peptidase [unclassified Aminobacterium]